MSKIGMNELLQIVKDSFEEQKGIKVLSLRFQKRENIIYGIYILPLEQSLSFTEEPLLDMQTDIDGHQVIMQELGQMLLYSYHFGSIRDYTVLTSGFLGLDINNNRYDELMTLCRKNVPLQRMTAHFLNWIELTDNISTARIQTFVKLCQEYCLYDGKLEYEWLLEGFDDAYIQQQFKNVADQLRHKKHEKISELIMHQINQLYIQLQVDLYMTDHKELYKNV